jgi:trk system potassium uptake protein TrkH
MIKRLNFRLLIYISGLILLIESAFMLSCLPVSLLYGSRDMAGFALSVMVTGLSGGILYLLVRKKVRKVPGIREGFLAVSLSWLLLSVFGTFPYIFTGAIPKFTDAWFETVSGFTTTGASIMTDIEQYSRELLFWRSLTHWIGGMGIILMVIVILPSLKAGGVYLFSAEASKISFDDIRPRVLDTARRFGLIYIILTVAEIILLSAGGMEVFDSVCHSFGTIATGGFSTKNNSIAGYSPYIQYVIALFMFLSGINFTLHFLVSQGHWRKALQNEELQWYFRITMAVTFVIGFLLYLKGTPLHQSFRDALFQVVSIITCTGFATADYLIWPAFGWFLIFILMFVGASAGSTGGGIKVIRHVLMMRNLKMELKSLLHPRAIYGVKYQGQLVSNDQLRAVIAFYFWYLAIFFFSTLLMMMLDADMETAAGSVASCMGGIGPGLGTVGPVSNYFHLPDASKYLLTFDMIIGRLEIYALLVLFSPEFWKW